MEFWRREYEEEQAVVFSGENKTVRKTNFIEKQNSCDQGVENENFKQVMLMFTKGK